MQPSLQEALENELTQERMNLEKKMRELRDQMHTYQGRLDREFCAQRDQDAAELRSRINTRAVKLEEAVGVPTCLYQDLKIKECISRERDSHPYFRFIESFSSKSNARKIRDNTER